MTSVFKSNSVRQPVDKKKQDMPGPGYYQVKPAFDKKLEKIEEENEFEVPVPFGSKVERFPPKKKNPLEVNL